MDTIRKNYILPIKRAIGNKFFGINIKYAKENEKDKGVDLYNSDEEYITTLDPRRLKVGYDALVEQNEFGIGRPKLKSYRLKKNRVKYTISPEGENHWYFLPYLSSGEMRGFLKDIDVKGDVTEILSRIIRGDIVNILVPENREPHIKNILRYGIEANPYRKQVIKDILISIRSNM
jgi:hypothetical protein